MINVIKKIGLSAILVLPSAAIIAVELTPGQPAPVMQSAAQNLTLYADEIAYTDWIGSSLTGKVRIVHHLNAALGVDEINKPFLDRVNDLNLDASAFTTLTVLNVGDVSYFLQQMAKLKIEDLRRSNLDQEFVLDKNSSVRAAWDLPEKGPSITLLDSSGRIVAHKDGKLEAEDEKRFLALIKEHIDQ